MTPSLPARRRPRRVRHVVAAGVLALGGFAAAGSVPLAGASFGGSSANPSSSLASATLAPPRAFDASLSCSLGVWTAQLTWMATASTWADGYRLERWRGASLEQTWTISPATTTSHTDSGGGLLGGQTYTYRIRAREAQAWVSSDATDAVTVPLLCL